MNSHNLAINLYLVITIFVTGCTANPIIIDQKYTFPEFEEVSNLSNFNLMGWEVVDSQSIIIQTGPSEYYLLVLGHRMSDLNFAETIILTSTGNRIEAKFDCVEVVEPTCSPRSIPAVINTIYKLDGQSGVSYVKNKIRQPG